MIIAKRGREVKARNSSMFKKVEMPPNTPMHDTDWDDDFNCNVPENPGRPEEPPPELNVPDAPVGPGERPSPVQHRYPRRVRKRSTFLKDFV